MFFNSDKYHIPSNEEMNDLHTEEEIENTIFVDSLCEEYDILRQPILPPLIIQNSTILTLII